MSSEKLEASAVPSIESDIMTDEECEAIRTGKLVPLPATYLESPKARKAYLEYLRSPAADRQRQLFSEFARYALSERAVNASLEAYIGKIDEFLSKQRSAADGEYANSLNNTGRDEMKYAWLALLTSSAAAVEAVFGSDEIPFLTLALITFALTGYARHSWNAKANELTNVRNSKMAHYDAMLHELLAAIRPPDVGELTPYAAPEQEPPVLDDANNF